jgi:tetratricopeptide (TPR) repeat protein
MRRKLLPILFGAFVWAMTSQVVLAQDARVCRESRDNNEGLEACNAALAQMQSNDSAEGDLYFYRGLRHSELKQFDEAISDYTQAIALARDVPSVTSGTTASGFQLDTGLRNGRLKQYNEVIDEYTRAIPLPAGLFGAYANRGLAYRAKKQYALALADLTKALELRPNYILTLIDRAAAEADLHQYSAAVADTDRAIESQPESFLAQGSGCMIRAVANDNLDFALDDCNRALARDPGYAQALVARGLIFLRRGDYAQAIADEDNALAMNAGLATAFYTRGQAKIKSGDAAGGKADTDAAIAITPDIAERYNDLANAP